MAGLWPERRVVPARACGPCDRPSRDFSGPRARGEAVRVRRRTRKTSTSGSDTPADIGFDVNYSVTPGLRASVTVNTDFAEVEVDDRQVNLTRFPLVFPEKRRDFFLEGLQHLGLCALEPSRAVLQPTDWAFRGESDPDPVRRAIDRASPGAMTSRFLQVRTGRTDLIAPEDFTVARLKRNFLAQSSRGCDLYAPRNPGLRRAEYLSDATVTRSAGISTSPPRPFMGDKNLQFEAFVVAHTDPLEESASDTPETVRSGACASTTQTTAGKHMPPTASSERDYDPAVGFVQRNGFRRFQPSISRSLLARPASPPSGSSSGRSSSST